MLTYVLVNPPNPPSSSKKNSSFFRVIGSRAAFFILCVPYLPQCFLSIIIATIKKKLQLRNSLLPWKVRKVHLKRRQAHVQPPEGHGKSHRRQLSIPAPSSVTLDDAVSQQALMGCLHGDWRHMRHSDHAFKNSRPLTSWGSYKELWSLPSSCLFRATHLASLPSLRCSFLQTAQLSGRVSLPLVARQWGAELTHLTRATQTGRRRAGDVAFHLQGCSQNSTSASRTAMITGGSKE